jgi:hypothetical protein
MTNIRAHALMVVAAALFAPAAFAASKPVTLELKLPKKSEKPAVAPPTLAPLFTTAPIAVALEDARGEEDPAVVGGQRIKGVDAYKWKAEQPVAQAVEAMVTQVLQGWSVRVAQDAEYTLRLALMTYYVNERSDTFGSTYLGEVRFMVSLTDRENGVLWTGEASGESKRPGVDGRAAMCNEALSYAMSRALAQGLASVKLEMAPSAAVAPTGATPALVPVAPENTIEPAALLADLTRLLAGGVTQDVLVAYVDQRKLIRPLTVDEILQWKNAGIPDAAIKAATRTGQ